MAQGDIPVEGSAVGPQGIFKIGFQQQGRPAQLDVNTFGRDRDLRIFLNNGAGVMLEVPLVSPGWQMRIFAGAPTRSAPKVAARKKVAKKTRGKR